MSDSHSSILVILLVNSISLFVEQEIRNYWCTKITSDVNDFLLKKVDEFAKNLVIILPHKILHKL